MIRKIMPLLILLLVISLSTACNAEDEDVTNKGKFIDGIYQGTGQGYEDKVKVEVKVDKGEIKEVRILKHRETEGLAEMIIKKMTNSIIKEQSTEVDVVSGGTMTSKAIKEAVKNALENAYNDEYKAQ